MPQFIIYTPKITPRIEYAMKVIFGVILGLEYVLTANESEYQQSTLFRINYGEESLSEEEVLLPLSGLLSEEGIREPAPEVVKNGAIPYFFATKNKGVFPFDLPALVFYLVSRYEEYLPVAPDEYGRYIEKNSIAYRNGFLQRPLVDEWVLELRKILQKEFPAADLPLPEYRFQPTYDVDFAWAYLNKGWLFWASFANDIRLRRWQLIRQRIGVKWGGVDDPFYFFDKYREQHLAMNPRPKFFFEVGDFGKYDKNCPWNHPKMQELIQKTDADFEVGIHPSFRSHTSIDRLKMEHQRLEKTLGHPVTQSRQHFLKMSLPETYQRLISIGITDDYTMGYAEETGFRAGIARPYPWYDLSKEQMTTLTIHPFQVMDVTLKVLLNLNNEESYARCYDLLEQTKKVGGTFVTLWHNSSFSPAHGWDAEWIAEYWKLLQAALVNSSKINLESSS